MFYRNSRHLCRSASKRVLPTGAQDMKNRKHTAAFFNLPAGISFALLCAVVFSAQANIITVVNTNDSGPGSLRQALADANDGDTINFDVSLKGQTIALTSGELVIDKSITITGLGSDQLAVGVENFQYTFR